MEVLQYLIEFANTPGAQVLRALGYLSWTITFWALTLAAFQYKWRFRYAYAATTLHITVVFVYASLLAVHISIAGPELNLVWSTTQMLVFASAAHGWQSRDSL